MKIASYNLQNLFHRDIELTTDSKSQNFQSWVEEFHHLMGKSMRSDTDFNRLRELAFLLGFSSKTTEPYMVLRKRGGQLYVKPKGVAFEERATAKVGWNGWVALQNAPIHEKAIQSKLKVLEEADADVLVLQEVEDRQALLELNVLLHNQMGIKPYDQFLFLEGDMAKGRGMALLLRKGFEVETMTSHAHVQNSEGKPLFDSDCPVYVLRTPKGERVVIINALFSKKEQEDDTHALQKQQAELVAQLYRKQIKKGKELVLICGTLNAPAYADALTPLLRDTQLKDVSKYEEFEVDFDTEDTHYFRMGAYRKGVHLKQRDYMLCSPVLFAQIKHAGLHRKGVWPEKPKGWTVYKHITTKEHAASEHPLLWGGFHGL